MEKDKVYLKRRQWLRPASSWGPTSSVHSSIALGTWQMPNATKRRLDGSLTLTDCSDHVRFDFDADNDKHYKAHLRMMDKLLLEVMEVRAAWVKAHDEVIERGGWKS